MNSNINNNQPIEIPDAMLDTLEKQVLLNSMFEIKSIFTDRIAVIASFRPNANKIPLVWNEHLILKFTSQYCQFIGNSPLVTRDIDYDMYKVIHAIGNEKHLKEYDLQFDEYLKSFIDVDDKSK